MAVKLKFLDGAKIKELVLQKGERVGLGVAVAISVLILGYGLMSGMSAGTPPAKYGSNWRDAIAQKNDQLKSKVEKTEPPPKSDTPPETVNAEWPNDPPRLDPTAPWVVLPETDDKRRNPPVVPIRFGDQEIQMDYVRAPLLLYSNHPKTRKVDVFITKGQTQVDGSKLVEVLEPRRMVVVSAVFPMKDQLEQIRHALRLYTIEEAMAGEYAPQFIGLNVSRCEIMPNGKPKEKAKGEVDWQPLYTYDAKKELQKEQPFNLAESLLPIFRDGTVDDFNVQLHAAYLSHGLATPLPKLAHGRWPRVELNGITPPKIEGEDKTGTSPPSVAGSSGGLNLPGAGKSPPGTGEGGAMPQAAGSDVERRSIEWTAVSVPEIKARLMGFFYVFNPLGAWVKDIKTGGFPGTGGEGMPPGPGAGPGRPPGPGTGPGPGTVGTGEGPSSPGFVTTGMEINNLLARFIDVDVQPGKTYRYAVKVIMANPNFNRTKDVAFESLAKTKELYSPWATTPPITIPGDFYYYAYNWAWENPSNTKLEAPVQKEGSEATQPLADDHPLYGSNAIKLSKGQVPVQLHKWIAVADGSARGIGDFAIAERVLLNRGQIIGRPNFMVDIPVWEPLSGGFTIENVSLNPKKKDPKYKFKAGTNTGIPINFLLEGGKGNPIVVDFVEGTKANRHVAVGKPPISDEAAQDVLIMTPEGKLIVRNARQDSDGDLDPNNPPPSIERKKRFDNWIGRLRAFRQAANANMPAGPGGSGEGR